jgi:hypothetical protein
MGTDLAEVTLKARRNSHWESAFREQTTFSHPGSNLEVQQESIDFKVGVVVEHLILV